MPGLPKVHVSILETITWKQEQTAPNIRSSNEAFFITKIKNVDDGDDTKMFVC